MRKKLEATLQELHDYLSSVKDIDEDQAEMLRASLAEIQATLDSQEVDSSSLAKSLVDRTLSFSETHPTLTSAVGRVADLLSQMGI